MGITNLDFAAAKSKEKYLDYSGLVPSLLNNEPLIRACILVRLELLTPINFTINRHSHSIISSSLEV